MPEIEVTAQHGGRVAGAPADRRYDRVEQVAALGERDGGAGGRQVGGAGVQRAGDVDAEPGPFLRVREILRRVDPAVHGVPRVRRPKVGQQPDAVRLAVAAPGDVAGGAVTGSLEGGHDRVAAVDVRQGARQRGHVVLTDLIEGDQVGHFGADHLGGPGHRSAGVAAGAAAVAEVHLEHPQDRGSGGVGGHRRSGRQPGGGDQAHDGQGSAQIPG
ncbi:hypothetical protein AB0C04_20135 [Micromonospora sp. NPDC048909]|uniref:hypothetical protein n=1 Tax=Micromonospora sp. NPDC048909 TaxID=3155643 RepID=UPI0033C9E5D0